MTTERKIYLCAGMYRSGSTWLYNAVRGILKHAGTPDLASGWIGEKEGLLAHRNVVMKVHSFDASLAASAEAVLVSHRDLRDVAASLQRFQNNHSLQVVRETFNDYQKWKAVAAYDLRYEQLLIDKLSELEKIAAALKLPVQILERLPYAAILHEIEAEKFIEQRGNSLGHDAVNLLHKGHITDGRHGSWKNFIPDEIIASIEKEFHGWMLAEGYSAPAQRSSFSGAAGVTQEVPARERLPITVEKSPEKMGQPVSNAMFSRLAREAKDIHAEWEKTFSPVAGQFLHPLWQKARPAFMALIQNGVPENFLNHAEVAHQFCRSGFREPQQNELNYLLSRPRALGSLLRRYQESGVGRPALECRELQISANSLGMLYYFTRIAEAAELESLQTIMEFGGGYGCLCRVFLELLPPTPTYIIIDLPEMLALQYVFLKASSAGYKVVPHTAAPLRIEPGAVNLVPVHLAESMQVQPDLFVSTFALSETPWKLQEKLAGRGFLGSKSVYIVGQETDTKFWQHAVLDSPQALHRAVSNRFAQVRLQPYHFACAWELFACDPKSSPPALSEKKEETVKMPVSQKRVGMLVVSKDRPLQLDAVLCSWKRHCQDGGSAPVKVLYKASTSRMMSLYRRLMQEHPEVDFVREMDFRREMLTLLRGMDYVLFVVDDTMFVRDFKIADAVNILDRNPDVLGFSLRLGRNTTYCYTMNHAQTLPDFESFEGGSLKFRWPGVDYDFGYSLEVSSSVYRSQEMLQLLEPLGFKNPNTMEHIMSCNTVRFQKSHPFLACWERSVAFSIPVNMVQQVCHNRAGANTDYSAERLAASYARGHRIQTQSFDGIVPEGCHQEVELKTALTAEPVPLVTVIMPCYKQAHYLSEAVASVVAQTFADWELIIVNDGSPDNTSQVARQLMEKHAGKRIRLLEKKNGGLAHARNAGIRAAAGAYILPLDADDKIEPAMLKKTVALLEENPAIAIAYTDVAHFGVVNRVIQAAEFDFRKICVNNQLNYCSLYRREAWELAGGYNSNLIWGYEDWDFWIGCGEQGLVARRIPGALLQYRVKDSSMYTVALARDRELRARIVLNHPALYDAGKLAEAKVIWSNPDLPAPTGAPRVSVIVPTCNRPERLEEILRGLAGQTFRDFEIIVVNENGLDVEHVINHCNAGVEILHLRHTPRSNALRHARGRYIASLDENDILSPDDLQKLVSQLEASVNKAVAAPPTENNSPLVSVILPTYNRPDRLAGALRSVFSQTLTDYEIIVVNDAGCDVEAVVAPLQGQHRIVCLRHETNKGIAAARNTGLDAACGKYIAYLDDDDVFYPDHLQTLVDFLESHPGTVAYTDAHRAFLEMVDGQWKTVRREVAWGQDWDNDKILVDNFVPTLCIMHERAFLEMAGKFDETLGRHEDWDLWIRLSRHFSFAHIRKVTCQFERRQDKSSLSIQGYAPFLKTMTRIHARYAEYVQGRPDLLKAQLAKRTELRQMSYWEAGTPKIKVGVFSLDEDRSACAQIRLSAPLNDLHAQGQVEFLPLCELRNGKPTLNQENIKQAELIVVQRGMPVCLPYHVLRAAIKNPSVKILFELDDALTHVPVGNPGFAYYQEMRPQLEAYLRHADLVTVSTPKLKELYSCYNKNIEVLPNSLDTAIWLPLAPKAPQHGKVSILFSGTLTHQNDLDLIEPAIELILQEFGDRVEFLFWGNVPPRLCNRPQIKGVAEFTQDYRQYVARLKTLPVDLALVPLEVIPFNQSKSDIKWLEYSACKIPAIFTDIEAYNQSVEHGKTGWLTANTVEGWHGAMKTLILDEALRRSIAENAHQAVLAKRTLEANVDLWLQAYQKTLSPSGKPNSATKPEVSIVIPTFNKLALTRECLLALKKNTPAGRYEIIIVDNASTDGTIEFLKSEEQAGGLRAILNRENAGFARACNQGAQAARGDLVLFLNNDTQAAPGWFDALTAAARRPQAGIAGAKLLYADGRIQHAGIAFIKNVPDHPHRYAAADAPEVNKFREMDMVTGACLMIRRELFLQLAGFDETYRNGVEDIDLCLRARAAGWKVVYEPKAVVYHLEGQTPGRFNHVSDNLKIFFDRWGKSFDVKKNFIAPRPAKTIAAKRSLFLSAAAVAWEGTFQDCGSLSHVNRQLTKCLAARPGIDLSLVDVAQRPKPASAKDTQITVRHQWPPDWTRPKCGALVVIQPWEFGALPTDWVKASAHVDEFWLPSKYVRQVYIDSGVAPEKLFVVPNGVDAECYREDVKPLPLATQKKFRFLFVGGTIHRKGPDLLVEAYLKNFTAADDVCLVIKDFGGKTVYAGQTFENQIKAAQSRKDAPEILYLTEELSAEAMPGLYAACQCLVHPYRGEGFGLPVLEAMACGLPVIVTGGGATDDFAGEEYVYRIASVRKGIGSEISGMKLAHEGWWLEPDQTALAASMKWVASHPAEAQRKGHAASEYARREWTWQRAAQIAGERLQNLLARKPATASAPAQTRAAQPLVIILPEAAKIGNLIEARELLKKKNIKVAKESICAAIQARPFHPEAWLLLGSVAQAAGDAVSARRCGQRATQLAPDWKPAKKFLKSLPNKNSKAGSFTLPPEAGDVPRLSVCLIVKNEEKFLEQCLQSIRDIASQIVVVDTGSTDRTVEIAKKFNAEVHFFTWNDDFSAARNEALKYVTGDWVLSLDADEELMPEHKQTIVQEMKAREVLGYRLPIFNQGQEKDGCGYVPRLFRNAPGLFFVGRVHEQIFSSLEARSKEWGLKISLGRAALLHHGYQNEVVASRDKIARNLRLLQQAVEEMPGEPNFVMNLGLELIRSGQLDAGLEKYREAVRLTSTLPPGQVTPEFCESMLTQLTTNLLGDARYREIVDLWQQPFPKSCGMTASQHFMLGMAHMELKEPAEAAEQMRQCLTKRGKPALSPINSHILTAVPRHCLALSLTALGQQAEAEQAFRDALREDAKFRPVRFDFAKFQFQNGQPVEALKIVNELVAENSRDIEAWQFGGQIALSKPEFLEFAQNWTSEAIKHSPDDPVILVQRAEALLLSQKVESALPLWTRGHSPQSARHMAALVLCEVLGGECRRSFPPATEKLVSQEFLKWYRRLITYKAHSPVKQINEKLEDLRAILPAAVGVLGAAMKHAEAALAV